MVVINTNQLSQYEDLEIKHLVEIRQCDCVIVTARERATGRSQIFLIFNHRGKIYRRNGLNGTWRELDSETEYSLIRQLLARAVENNTIPCYSTKNRLAQ